MKKLLCGILCLLMLLGCASAEGYWYAAKGDNGLWGHIDETGNWVIPPKFDSAGDFRGNYAWIQQGDREGFANRDGEIVLLLDESGKEYPLPEGINAANCDTVISGGLFEVVDENGLYGYCNTSGEVVIEPQFAYTFEFEDGYAEVELTDGTYGVIDQTGKVVMRTTDTHYADVRHGCYVLPTGEHSFTMYSVAGEELFTLQGENIVRLWTPEENGLCMYVVEKGRQRRCGWVNMQGEIISEAKWTFPEYDQPDVYFPSGLQAVYDIDGTRLAGYLDESGELAIPLQFSFVTQFYGELAYVGMVQDDGTTQYGYINQQGEWVYSWTE